MAGFTRDTGNPEGQFVPAKGYKTLPLGSAEEQAQEAMELAKARNREDAGMSWAERANKLDGMNVNQAIEFLDGLSQYERDLYIEAERKSKNRKMIFDHMGVPR